MKMIFFAGLLVLGQFSAWAGDRLGNGGGGWVCYNQDKSVRWAMLADLFEAQKKYGVLVEDGLASDNKEISNYALKEVLKLHWLGNELGYNITHELQAYTGKMMRVPFRLGTINDANYTATPDETDCVNGKIVRKQLAIFYGQGEIAIADRKFVNNEVMSLNNQAALLSHESLYIFMKKHFPELANDSDVIRKINGLLYVQMPQAEFIQRVKELLLID